MVGAQRLTGTGGGGVVGAVGLHRGPVVEGEVTLAGEPRP